MAKKKIGVWLKGVVWGNEKNRQTLPKEFAFTKEGLEKLVDDVWGRLDDGRGVLFDEVDEFFVRDLLELKLKARIKRNAPLQFGWFFEGDEITLPKDVEDGKEKTISGMVKICVRINGVDTVTNPIGFSDVVKLLVGLYESAGISLGVFDLWSLANGDKVELNNGMWIWEEEV